MIMKSGVQPMNPRFTKIRRASVALRVVVILGMVGIVALLAMLIALPTALEAIVALDPGNISEGGINRAERFGLWCVMVLASLPTLYALNQLRLLFTAYAQGDILSARAATCLSRFGQGLLAMCVAGVLAETLKALVLTWGNVPGNRQLVLSASDSTYALALMGGFMIVIGWAMSEAAAIDSEMREIV